MKTAHLLPALLFLLQLCTPAHAFNAGGHMVIGLIAYDHQTIRSIETRKALKTFSPSEIKYETAKIVAEFLALFLYAKQIVPR